MWWPHKIFVTLEKFNKLLCLLLIIFKEEYIFCLIFLNNKLSLMRTVFYLHYLQLAPSSAMFFNFFIEFQQNHLVSCYACHIFYFLIMGTMILLLTFYFFIMVPMILLLIFYFFIMVPMILNIVIVRILTLKLSNFLPKYRQVSYSTLFPYFNIQ